MLAHPFDQLGASRLDPLAALEEVSAALIEGRLVEPTVAQYVGLRLRTYLEGKDPDLRSALGVAVGRGGRSKTAAARKAMERRRSLVRSAFDAMGDGSRTQKAKQLCALLKAGTVEECPDPLRALLAPIAREFASGISDRQILRLSVTAGHDTK